MNLQLYEVGMGVWPTDSCRFGGDRLHSRLTCSRTRVTALTFAPHRALSRGAVDGYPENHQRSARSIS
eukprot:4147139-Prymnesium_polylepis.1